MKFIKLTLFSPDVSTYVNAERISFFHACNPKGTHIFFYASNGWEVVKETPEEILSKINGE